MDFLQPMLLFGLPLIGLPILIHLINRQRHRTLNWGAMIFLLDAKRLTKGIAKLRYWLIMAMRMLAIAGLLFAVARPLASGWLGSTVGSRADTTIVLLDRSSSMEQQAPLTGKSKRQTAVDKLSELLSTTASGNRIVLVENTRCKAEEISGPKALASLPTTVGSDTSADIPKMMQATLDYLVDNEVGQADIWIASDLRGNDWREDDGRWSTLQQKFAEREGIRFHLLTYPELSPDNLSLTVQNVRKRKLDMGNELVLDIIVRRDTASSNTQTLPIEFVINGARSVLDAEIGNDDFVLQGHTIPLDASQDRGWGRVEIPGDANPTDNAFYFVFADETPRFVTIVADDERASAPFRIASVASPDPSIEASAVILPSSRVNEIDWDRTSLVIWQSPLPGDLVVQQLTTYLKSGRPVLFFPPENPTAESFQGISWGAWYESKDEPIPISTWNGQSDLLANTLSGTALPVNKLRTTRYCEIKGTGTSLARLSSGAPLLLRADGELPIYFVTTLPRNDHSSLARDGVMLYVMLQRAIETGALQQGDARLVETGSLAAANVAGWKSLSEQRDGVISADRLFYSGAYGKEGLLRAVNRPANEDLASVVNAESIEKMFSGLDYHQINDQLADESPLANEIWRAFLAAMAFALIVEALLCLF